MTVLQALSGYYGRMAERGEAEAPGYSREKFGWCVVIAADGEPVAVDDLHDTGGRKPALTLREVPAAAKRTVGILPNLFWDKTAYTLGRTAGEGRRTAQEHAAFRAANLAAIADADDPGLAAFRRFLERWTPSGLAPRHSTRPCSTRTWCSGWMEIWASFTSGTPPGPSWRRGWGRPAYLHGAW